MNNTITEKEISAHEATIENLAAAILEKEEIIKSLMENSQSMGETNRVMGARLVKFEAALRNIAEHTYSGYQYEVNTRSLAKNALKL